MRFHRLSVSAFGPFPGTESVDFDDLNAGGLFLLTGPTGAGKTSILDAICFALYGSVPGTRGTKLLKSQHAAPDARPEVVLDFSIGGRRFMVRRSPEWARPKRRGEGETTEKASASLVETTDGTEHFLSSRAQEVGHLVSGLIGMRASQFVQVAMLPQGEFARFLRADSQDRHEVLQQLFKTDRFSRIEEWVHERSKKLRECAGEEQARVQRALDAVADRSAAELPEHLSGTALATADPDQVRHWAAEQLSRTELAHAAARAARTEADAGVRAAREEHDRAAATANAVARRDEALSARDSLVPEPEAEAARAALDADARAARCLPVLRLLAEASHAAAAAGDRKQAAVEAVAQLGLSQLGVPHGERILDAAALAGLARSLRDKVARTEALLPRERAVRAAQEGHSRAEARLAQLHADIDTCRARLAQIPAEQAGAREELAALTDTASTAPVVELELAAARAALEAADQVPSCEAELGRLQERCRDARDRAADARDTMQDLVGRRLAGMAAELAGRLENGSPCPVCGSCEHPAAARAAADAVTEAEQSAATDAYHRATAEHTAASGQVVDAERRLESLRQAAGGRLPEQAQTLVDQLEQRLDAARRAATARECLEAHLRTVEAEREQLTSRLHDRETERAGLRQALEDHARTIAAAEQDVAAALGETTPASLDELLERLRHCLGCVEAAEQELRSHDEARARLADLTDRSAESIIEAGFTCRDDVRRAVLDDERRGELERLLTSRAELLARVDATLWDPQVRAVADQPMPDLEAARRSLEEAEQAGAAAARLLHQHEEALIALGQHRDRLEDALAAWQPVRVEHERTAAIARLVRGTGPDNYLQMRLSAYVLATRLDQVLDAANERLGQMRDQRYLLERTGRASRRNAQAGLGLQVLDSWTGEVRDPATLSGGETFVVSLSLALGLADVVSQEAGGAEIDTLFVDEGFGSLDADTLDDVMDRLDDLRAGGRSVGVVSHVAEMRTRIPTQLHVEKRRSGSRLAVRTLTA